MSEPTMEALARRIERLERETRWWKRMTGLGLMLLAAVGVLGQVPLPGTAKALDAERFNLRDSAGNLRATLGSSADGATSLLLYGPPGVHQAGLAVMPDGSASIFLGNPAGRTVTELTLYRDGTPTLVFRDRAGKTRSLVGASSDGAPFAYFLDAAGNNTWKAP